MSLKPEIKDFIRKILLLSLLLSFLINLAVLYVSSVTGAATYAQTNDELFARAGSKTLGTTGIALSMNIGTNTTERASTPVTLAPSASTLGRLLADTSAGKEKMVAANMVAIQAYYNVLKTDIPALLDRSYDRESMLSSFIDQLETRYTDTVTTQNLIASQASELAATVSSSDAKIEALKTQLSTAYGNLDYDRTEEIIQEYLAERERNTYARTYLVFLSKFAATYTTLNNYNKVLLDTLINNKEALVKRATIVFPDSGTNLLQSLKLVESEADYKANR
ncbi:MAG TPA: hypothetical protein PK765_00485 [bacterium]|nr:hypothetical protein [bacterium]